MIGAWFKGIKIRYKIALMLSAFALGFVLIVASVWSSQFSQALQDRIFLQLNSIRTLKTNQVQRLLENHLLEIEMLLNNMGDKDYLDALAYDRLIYIDSIIIEGEREEALPYHRDSVIIEDFSSQQNDGKVHLAFHVPDDEYYYVFYLTPERLQEILFERNGMGETGETYIVGEDGYMRTESRFLVDVHPAEVVAITKATQNAIKKGEGTLICDDYRGVPVLSSHAKFEFYGLHWIILSEIDKAEGLLPIKEMQSRVYFITLLIILAAFVSSYFVSIIIVNPILEVKEVITQVSKGGKGRFLNVKSADEMGDLRKALNNLMATINRVINFANEISGGTLGADMQVRDDGDELVQALNNMKNQLADLKETERLLLLKNQRQLLAGEERERARLSRELHDSIGPLLTNLKLSVQHLQQKGDEDLDKQIIHIIEEVRKISFNLMPSVLKDFGLIEAVKNYLDIQFKHVPIKVNYKHSQESKPDIPLDLALNIYRIIQEAMHNIIKHSGATDVHVSITVFHDQVDVFIADNGNGFDLRKKKSGNGLVNMEERIKMFNGWWSIESGQKGTRIEIEFNTKNKQS